MPAPSQSEHRLAAAASGNRARHLLEPAVVLRRCGREISVVRSAGRVNWILAHTGTWYEKNITPEYMTSSLLSWVMARSFAEADAHALQKREATGHTTSSNLSLFGGTVVWQCGGTTAVFSAKAGQTWRRGGEGCAFTLDVKIRRATTLGRELGGGKEAATMADNM